jgi:hypothetical protein
MSKIKAKFINTDPNTLQASGDNLQVKVKESSPIIVEAGEGLTLKPDSISSDFIKDAAVTENKLDVTNSPANGQVLSWNQTIGKMEWSAAGSNDSKDVKVSANDNVPGFLSSKITGAANKIVVTEFNDAANESLQIEAGQDLFDKTKDDAKDVKYDAINVKAALDTLRDSKANNADVVHLTGDETISGNKTFQNDVVVNGNLVINGSTTTVNSRTVSTGDNIIELNNEVTGTPTEDGGIEINRGSEQAASLIWDEAADRWKAGLKGTEAEISLTGHAHTKSELSDYDESAYVHTTGNESVAGVKTFLSIPKLPEISPSGNNDAVRKAYVDDIIERKYVEIRTLTSGEVAAKNLSLSFFPKQASAVQVTPQGGPEQLYSEDFNITGKILSWLSLGLDGLLAIGDKIIITYTY